LPQAGGLGGLGLIVVAVFVVLIGITPVVAIIVVMLGLDPSFCFHSIDIGLEGDRRRAALAHGG
jgi:hypothetical protein